MEAGAGSQAEAVGRFRQVGAGLSEGGSDYEGKGCNELAALRSYRNVSCLLPPLRCIHLNCSRDGQRRKEKMR